MESFARSRIAPLLLLYALATGCVEAEDCSKFPINNLVKDTVKFALECGGEETLGLKSRKVFHARYLNQAQFNNLFKKAVTTSFEIRIEYTTFTEIAMPFLTNAKRPRSARDRLFVIRENYDLKSINIPKSTFDVTEPFHVEIDSNPVLDEATLKRFRENCRAKLNKDCDIFEADPSMCDALTPDDMETLKTQCRGVKVIKQASTNHLTLDVSELGEEVFNDVFSRATHVQMCIHANGTNFKKLLMPKLKHLFPCKKQEMSLNVNNNPNLESIVLGDPANNNEKVVINMHIRQNPRLGDENIKYLKDVCNNKPFGLCVIGNGEDTTTTEAVITQEQPRGSPGGGNNNLPQATPDSRAPKTTKKKLPPVVEEDENENEDDYGGGWFGGPDISMRENQDRNKKRELLRKKRMRHKSHRKNHLYFTILFMIIYLFL